jgi:hypothetical protein
MMCTPEPMQLVYHTTSRAKLTTMAAFRPIIITKNKNMQKFDAHMLFGAWQCRVVLVQSKLCLSAYLSYASASAAGSSSSWGEGDIPIDTPSPPRVPCASCCHALWTLWSAAGLCKIIQPDSVFLTDCSTRFTSNCLLLLQTELLRDSSLVGVTARMRVMSVADTFEVTEEAMAFDVDTSYSKHMVKRGLRSGAHCSGWPRLHHHFGCTVTLRNRPHNLKCAVLPCVRA